MTDAAPITETIGRAQLAERFGVEPWTISNYAKRGMPCRKVGRSYEYDVAACDAWLAANRDADGQFANRSTGAGGKRPGAGRPKGSGVVKSEDGAANTVKIAVTSEDLLSLVREGITPAEISASANALKLLKEVTEYEKDAGQLVDAEEAAATVREWCVDLRERMLQVAPRVAARAGELGLSQADAVRLRTVVEEVVHNVLATARADAMEEV